jgi:hypothetical protein
LFYVINRHRVLGTLFAAKRDKVTGEWRRLRNEELYEPYSSSNVFWLIKSRIMRWAGHVACMGGRRGAYRVLLGSPVGKRLLGKPMA